MDQKERERIFNLLLKAEEHLEASRVTLNKMRDIISKTDPLDPEFAKDVKFYKAGVNEYLRRQLLVSLQKAKIGMVGKKLVD